MQSYSCIVIVVFIYSFLVEISMDLYHAAKQPIQRGTTTKLSDAIIS